MCIRDRPEPNVSAPPQSRPAGSPRHRRRFRVARRPRSEQSVAAGECRAAASRRASRGAQCARGPQRAREQATGAASEASGGTASRPPWTRTPC
eukprot:5118285-Prymnesium_polylepis.1